MTPSTTAKDQANAPRRRPTTYIRVSARIHEHPDLTGLPSDSARWAFLVILCEAKLQPEPGVFRSMAHLQSVVGWRLSRTLPALFGAGLLEHPEIGSSDGRVVVHNWSRWQSVSTPDRTQADRSRRYRAKRRGQRHGSVTAVTQPSRVTAVTGDPPLQGYDDAHVTGPEGEAPVTVRGGDGLQPLDSVLDELRGGVTVDPQDLVTQLINGHPNGFMPEDRTYMRQRAAEYAVDPRLSSADRERITAKWLQEEAP